MGFGKTIEKYLSNVHGDDDEEGKTLYHMDYQRLKRSLKHCMKNNNNNNNNNNNVANTTNESCLFCDETFMVELRRESLEVEKCFSYRVKEVVRLHAPRGLERCVATTRRYFFNDLREIAKECRRLMQYAADNANAMHKIIQKYNQVHNSNGGSRNSESSFGAKNLNILQSPWLKELGALYINLNESNGGNYKDLFNPFYCDLNPTDLVITLKLSKSLRVEYSITCPICLDIVFHPHALGCGHFFCKECACAAASVKIAKGLKAAAPYSKCPTCRQEGVYADAKPLRELGLLLKKRNKKYWRERRAGEYEAKVKQSADANSNSLFVYAF